jgi:hypothetical protein
MLLKHGLPILQPDHIPFLLRSAVRLSAKNANEVSASDDCGLPLGIDLRSWAVDLMERLFDAAVTLQGSREAAGTHDDAYATSNSNSNSNSNLISFIPLLHFIRLELFRFHHISVILTQDMLSEATGLQPNACQLV